MSNTTTTRTPRRLTYPQLVARARALDVGALMARPTAVPDRSGHTHPEPKPQRLSWEERREAKHPESVGDAAAKALPDTDDPLAHDPLAAAVRATVEYRFRSIMRQQPQWAFSADEIADTASKAAADVDRLVAAWVAATVEAHRKRA